MKTEASWLAGPYTHILTLPYPYPYPRKFQGEWVRVLWSLVVLILPALSKDISKRSLGFRLQMQSNAWGNSNSNSSNSNIPSSNSNMHGSNMEG